MHVTCFYAESLIDNTSIPGPIFSLAEGRSQEEAGHSPGERMTAMAAALLAAGSHIVVDIHKLVDNLGSRSADNQLGSSQWKRSCQM